MSMECTYKNRSLLGIQNEFERNKRELKIIERVFSIAEPRLVYRWNSRMQSEDVFEENWLYLLFIDCECGEEHPIITYETVIDHCLRNIIYMVSQSMYMINYRCFTINLSDYECIVVLLK
jgi:hypothetical protein